MKKDKHCSYFFRYLKFIGEAGFTMKIVLSKKAKVAACAGLIKN